ncbi:PAB-dependent poly(A)-specific ribonuclease subunit 3 [Friedmanniomyces endolithicus]|nr:PAB-dependent poly(A)-specific ribonuclease subunit 3 [Friedmanniomyces endolithicus]
MTSAPARRTGSVLNVESPSFTPNFTPKPANALPVKGIALSPRAAGAPAFTPRGSGTWSHKDEIRKMLMLLSEEFVPQQIFPPQQQFSEFVPGQSFVPQQQVQDNSRNFRLDLKLAYTKLFQVDSPPQLQAPINPYGDPFMSPQSLHQAMPSLDGSQQMNPYSQAVPGAAGQQFYQDNNSYRHPLNYHLYASVGPRRENMHPYQRASADFFIPDNIRDDLHKKSEAALQVFANSTLPQTVEHFHSLVALDTTSQRGTTPFGYPSWIYKATSSKDGHTRLPSYERAGDPELSDVEASDQLQRHSYPRRSFTGRWFGDSSLIVVTDYHPLAQTLAEKYFPTIRSGKSSAPFVAETDLWGYLVQLANALRSVHEAGFAAQTVTATKVLLTAKNRIRLNGCGVLDITQYEQQQPATDLQRLDLQDLGRLMLSLAARNSTAHQNTQKSLEFISRAYSERFRLCLAWLLTPPTPTSEGLATTPVTTEHAPTTSDYTIANLLTNIADKAFLVLDSTLHYEDELTNNLMRELENGRLVRLLTKLNVVLERPEMSMTPTSHNNQNPDLPSHTSNPHMSSAWSETGERYYLKLFRDYVFHQCDSEGRPVLNLGHIVTCLNKLDAGVDELVQLVSRDERDVLVVSYREVKRGFEGAWGEVGRAAASGGGGGGVGRR